MPTSSQVLAALEQEDALCDSALIGLSDWLAEPSRIPLRHPLTACCSVILRHIDIEENIVFPRLLVRTAQHSDLIGSLQVEHLKIRDQLHDIEDLVMSELRDQAREALSDLRTLLAQHANTESTELFAAIADCITDPDEIGHLFHSGYLRGIYNPFAGKTIT